VDFTEAFSPVVHDVSFRLLIIMQMIFKRKAMIMDVEVAFLNGDLEEESIWSVLEEWSMRKVNVCFS
jgi:hypothetical protein